MATTGFRYASANIPAPPVSYSTGTTGPCVSTGTGPHGHRYHCGRRAGHTGRHASYGVQRVIATWSQ